MFIDTHCHLNFKAFEKGADKILARAKKSGVGIVVIPGTDISTSQTALDIVGENTNTYALVGIHPHHAHQYAIDTDKQMSTDLIQIETWLQQKGVVGIGEVGLDRHAYSQSRYGPMIEINETMFQVQKRLFTSQVKLASQHNKSLCIHNREATNDLLNILDTDLKREAVQLAGRVVLHCCEPDHRLLNIAKSNNYYIGIDGDITFDPNKQEYIRSTPLTMLVLETDAPYILPEPLRSQKKYPNEPSNIPFIAQMVASLKKVSVDEVAQITSQNARSLFALPE